MLFEYTIKINIMKKLIIISICILVSNFVSSQDVIIRNSGEKINCKITGVDSTTVYFKFFKDGREINTFLNKSTIEDIQYGSINNNSDLMNNTSDYTKCVSIGILHGGGGLLGLDMEFKLTDHLGIQAGAGLFSFGGGLNYHFKPTIRSSYLSLLYWHQGIGSSYTESLIGPSLVFRGKKWFTAQIGLGALIEKGPAWPDDTETVPFMLTYAIGIYFPSK
jgi:hypothetical protein